MRLGDLDALKKKIEGVQYSQEFCIEHQIDYSVSMQMLGMVIDSIPPVEAYPFEQVQELVKLNQQFAKEIENLKNPQGEWIYGEDEQGQDGWFCSECGFFVPWYYEFYEKDIHFIREYKVCPHCLAEMITYTGKDRDMKNGADMRKDTEK